MSDGSEGSAGMKFYNNIWLLLGIGIVLPTVLFTVWGLFEVVNTPYLPLVK